MTDRTCGTCAWWDDRDKVEYVNHMWQQRATNGDVFPYIGPGRCMHDPASVAKEPDDFCRHHATTRGWGEDRPLIDWANYPMQTKIEEGDPAKPLFAHVMDENARLKARCQEARKVIERAIFYAAEWQGRRDAWLEASDDA